MQVHEEIQRNLEPGEMLKNIVETFSLKKTPEFLALTDRRVLYLNKKLFGRYYFQSIPYMKMQSAKAKISKAMWGEFLIEGEEEQKIHIKRVKKNEIVLAFESMKEAINDISIEPLSIIHKKGLLGEEWALSKPPEMIIRQKSNEDPLSILKMRYAKGEITAEEFTEMKKVLES